MKKPSIEKMRNTTTFWFDGGYLRLVLSEQEQKIELKCGDNCRCYGFDGGNSWWFDDDRGDWVSSFFTAKCVRSNYAFIGV